MGDADAGGVPADAGGAADGPPDVADPEPLPDTGREAAADAADAGDAAVDASGQDGGGTEDGGLDASGPADVGPPPPANDTCAGATEVPAAGTSRLEGTTTGAGHHHAGHRSDSPDVFYRFRLETPASLVVEMESAPAWDTWLALLAGSCDDARPIAHDDDLVFRQSSRLAEPDLPAGDYLVVATGYGPADRGPFSLTASFGPPATCGDGVCAPDVEDPERCPRDCHPPPPCGDGLCEDGETPAGCPRDCRGCGDGSCDLGETHATCPDDCPARPANDRCESAEALAAGDGPWQVEGSTRDAAPDVAAFCDWGQSESPDVFYRLELLVSGLVRLHLTGSEGWDPALFVLADGCDGPPAVLGCSDEGPACTEAALELPLDPGLYLVMVAGFSAHDRGDFVLDVEVEPRPEGCREGCADRCGDGRCDAGAAEDWLTCPEDCISPCGDGVCSQEQGEDPETCPGDCDRPDAPPGDTCEDAVGLVPGDGQGTAGTTLGARHDHPGQGPASPDVFLGFTLEELASVTVRVETAPAWDVVVHLLAGECSRGQPVTQGEADPAGLARLAVPSLAAGGYLLVVTGRQAGDAGAFTLSVELGDPVACDDGACAPGWESWRSCPEDCPAPPPPGNDTCEAAEPIPAEGTQALSGSTLQTGHDFTGHGEPAADVFFGFSLGEPAFLDLQVAAVEGWDTVLYLLSGPCGDPTPVGDNDDCGGFGGWSCIRIPALDPGGYLVVVTGYSEDDAGDFELSAAFDAPVICGDGSCTEGWEHWRTCSADCEGPPAPANDTCETARVVPAAGETVLDDSTAAARMDFAGREGADVFYSFTLEEPAAVEIDMEAADEWDTYLFLLAGPCEAAAVVEDNDDFLQVGRSRIARGRLEPGVYHVVATGYSPSHFGDFTITFTFEEPGA